MLTLPRTWLGLKEVDVEPKVLPQFEMQFVLRVQKDALQFVGAVVVIIAFLGLIGEGVEVALVGTVIIVAFLS